MTLTSTLDFLYRYQPQLSLTGVVEVGLVGEEVGLVPVGLVPVGLVPVGEEAGLVGEKVGVLLLPVARWDMRQ